MQRAFVGMILAAAVVSGCAAPVRQAPPPSAAVPPPRPYSPTGLEAVLGRNANALVQLFGQPELDLREGPARKLQFLSPVCVLDTYLYPPRGGRGEPVVTHVDARLPDGREMDRASCVAALSRRSEAQ